ncbi:MAG TPA: hypothetical protein VLG14_19700 [Sphingomonas sp.]|nr:hypothetical protein [Sphingomonas sp.]
MKLLALAAALAMTGSAAFAQDTQPAPAAPAAPATAATEDPVGGYQPSAPLIQGDTSSGQKPIFQPNPQTPTQAFPPPPPLDKYPLCKKGQFDNCRQRGG